MKPSDKFKILIATLILLAGVSCRETAPETDVADEPAEKAQQMHHEGHDEGAMMADDKPMEEESMEY